MKYKPNIVAYTLFYLFILGSVYVHGDSLTGSNFNQTSITKCEGDTAKLSCPDGMVISIVLANYGRFSVSPCNFDASPDINTNCANEDTMPILKKKCQDRGDCVFNVSSSLFGDKCAETTKYLETIYECKPAPATTTTSTTTTTPRPTTVTVHKSGGLGASGDLSSNEIVEYSEQTTAAPRFCPSVFVRHLDWPETEVGRLARITCPAGTTGHAEWQCSESGEWYPKTGADLSRCVSDWTEKMEKEVDEGEDKMILVEALKDIHSHTRRQTLIGGELIKITAVVEKVVDNYVKMMKTGVAFADDRKVGYKMNKFLIESFNYLLGSSQRGAWFDLMPQKQKEIASSLLNSSERLLAAMFPVTALSSQEVDSDNIVAKPNILAQASSVRVDDYVVFPSVPIDNDVAYIPREALEASGRSIAQVVYANYQGVGEYLRPLKDPKTHASRKVASGIITLSVVSHGRLHAVRRIAKPVVLEFFIDAVNVENPQCVSWDGTQNEWNGNGCLLKKFNGTYATCECDHISHFAVLTDVFHGSDSYQPGEVVTEIVVMSSCVLAGLLLLIAWLAFAIIGESACERNWIYANLTFVLVVAQVVFLVGLQYSKHELICSIVAGLLPAVLLSVFGWMLMESMHLFHLLTRTFSWAKKIVMFFAGNVAPLVAAGTFYYVIPHGYGSTNHCWLTNLDKKLWNLYAPVGVIVFITLIFLMRTFCNVMTDYTLCKHEIFTSKTVRKWLMLCFANLFFIGSTWTLAVLWLEQRAMFIGYLFALFNVIGATFILLLHVFLNEKIHKDYADWSETVCWLPGCMQPNQMNQSTGPYLASATSTHRCGISRSLTGSENMFSGAQHWTLDRFNQLPAVLTSNSMERRAYSASTSRDVSAHYQPRANEETYDYATIPYEEEQRRSVYPSRNQFDSMRNYGVGVTPVSAGFATSSRPPPNFKPPAPPPISSLPLSDDSAYSDSGASSSRSPNSNAGVSRSGTMLLRMDLTKNPPVFCQGV